MLSKWLIPFMVLIATASSAQAADDLQVRFSQMHARPSINGISAAYFTATSTKNDSITGVTSTCCKAVELHRSEKINGIMSMRHVGEFVLKKNKPLEVQPGAEGGQHVMLMGMEEPLEEGDEAILIFTFKKAPPQKVAFPVHFQKKSDGDEHSHH